MDILMVLFALSLITTLESYLVFSTWSDMKVLHVLCRYRGAIIAGFHSTNKGAVQGAFEAGRTKGQSSGLGKCAAVGIVLVFSGHLCDFRSLSPNYMKGFLCWHAIWVLSFLYYKWCGFFLKKSSLLEVTVSALWRMADLHFAHFIFLHTSRL